MNRFLLALTIVASSLVAQSAKPPCSPADSAPRALDQTIQPAFIAIDGVNFLLAYSDLTRDRLKDVIRSEITRNFAAIEKIAEITASLDSNPTDMIGFLDELPAKLGSDSSDLLNGFTWQSLGKKGVRTI